MGRPLGDHDARRADILRAARAVIATEGYSSATVRRVAQQAGCSTGVLTYYFTNKDDLIGAVVDELFAEAEGDLDLHQGDAWDVRTFLETALIGTAALGTGAWHVWCQLLVQAGTSEVLRERFQDDYRRFRAQLAQRIAASQARGALRRDLDAERLADHLSAVIDGWLVMRPLEPRRLGRARIQRLIDDTVTMLGGPARAPG